MPLDPDREIYPNAPLRLVAFELRFPQAPEFDAPDGHRRLYAALRDAFPIIGPPPITQLHIDDRGARHQERGIRLLDRRRTQALAITDTTFSLETSAYTRFEHFSQLLEHALRVTDAIGQVPAMERVGLRYIDEISVPGVSGIESWRDYIVDDLIAAGSFHGYPTVDYRVGLTLVIDSDHLINIRAGVTADRVVNPDGPLRILGAPDGEYFLLDLDSYWSAPAGEYPEFSTEATLTTVERLHEPIRMIFERAIKPRLRDEVLRVPVAVKEESSA